MRTIEIEAKNVKEATVQAAKELACEPDSLKVEILEEKKGFLGVGKKIKILASLGGDNSGPGKKEKDFSPDRVNDEPPAVNENDTVPSWAMNPDFDPGEALEKICKIIIPECFIETSQRDGKMLLNIKGDGSGIFIGRKGHTLEALRFTINKMYLKQTGRASHIIVDSEGYIIRKIEKLKEKAKFLAGKSRDYKRSQTTEPLNPHDRRIIHTTVRKLGGFTTRSMGAGEFKRVQISSKQNR